MRELLAFSIIAAFAATPAFARDGLGDCDGPDLRHSIEACTELLRKPQSAADQFLARRNRAIRELALGDLTAARDDAERAIRLNGKDVVIRVVDASALIQMNRLDDAEGQLDEALKLDPNSAQAWTAESLAEVKSEHFDKAIAAASRAIELHPENVAAFNNRGLAYRGKGYGDKAIANFDAAIRIDPNNFKSFYNRGMTYKTMGHRQSATTDLERAVLLNPKDSESKLSLDKIKSEAAGETMHARQNEISRRTEARYQDSVFIAVMENNAINGNQLTAAQLARIKNIDGNTPELHERIQNIFKALDRFKVRRDDVDFAARLRTDCRDRRFSDEEIKRLSGLDKSVGAASLLANQALGCQRGYISQLEGEEERKRLLEASPSECQDGFGKLEIFVNDAKGHDPLIEASELADAGDDAGACKLIEGVVQKAEAVRANMVACYHALPDLASDERSKLRQAALAGAGQMHGLQEQLRPATQKLGCGG